MINKIKKNIYCRFFHRKYLCYPEVWGRGLKGPWHCSECHPCGESIISPKIKIKKGRES
jgi:hypothetical protein